MSGRTLTQLPSVEVDSPRPPLTRLSRVELRKMYDTRAGKWLLAAIGALTVAVEVFVAFTGGSERTLDAYFGGAVLVQVILVPVLVILLVTSEWSQRTALVTFGLEPDRLRVAVAKAAACAGLALAALVLTVGMSSVLAAVAGHGDVWDLPVSAFGEIALLVLVNVMQALAFGLLLMNSSAALVTFYVLPTGWAILFGAWSALGSVKNWLDLNTATEPLGNHEMTGAGWLHLVVAATIWVVLPMALGVSRLLRTEFK